MIKLNRILLVDDDNTVNFYNQFLLKKLDVALNIDVATNGKEALEYLKTKIIKGDELEFPRPELILLDINMPVMNGFEFLEHYKELDEVYKGDMIICMVTTSLHQADKDRAGEFKEICDYIPKPISEESVAEIFNKFFVKD